MRKHTLVDGSKGRLAEAQDMVEWRDRQRVTTRCAACRRTHRGTAAEGRAWHAEHRRKEHPELAAVGRRVSPRAQRARAMQASEWKRTAWSKEGE